jgi:Rha family phage regulatory protein
MSALPMIRLSGDTLVTTSLVISQQFQKQHKDVLKAIANLDCSDEFRQRNFAPTVQYRANPTGGNGIPSKIYEMTKDGFMYLAMGFTGAKAAQWKERFIAEFNRMADMLNNRPAQFSKRGQVAITRKLEREVFELFVAGFSGAKIAKAVGISPSSASCLLNAKYQFSPQAGEPECSPDLIEAVAARHLQIELQQDALIAERRAQRFLSNNHNHQLANALTQVGTRLLDPVSAEQYHAWALEDEVNGDHEAANLNRAAAAALGGAV